MEELIIHPRTRQDFYGNKPNLEVFKDAISLSKNPVCYNGDIFTLEDHNKLVEEFKEVDKIMLGRGILANPALMNEILNKWLGEILFLIFGITLIVSILIGVVNSRNHDLEMTKLGYIQKQAIGTSKLIWFKE